MNETYKVLGTAKAVQSREWIPGIIVEFAGHQSIFRMRKEDFLTKAQKASLRWVKKHLGQRQHDKLRDEIYDSVITDHTYVNR